MTIDLIVWDFDGVLNANMRDGRFVWTDHLDRDLGVDPKAFSEFVFGSGVIRDVVRGRLDLLDVVRDWLAAQNHPMPARAFLSYWFEQDAIPDHQVIDWMQRHPARRVIGTNNETHRTGFIEQQMGFDRLVERVFSSGRMGVAKPDAAFFAAIEDWSGIPPARIVLVDDTAANIRACQARGWQGFHFTPQTRSDLPKALDMT